MIKKEKALPAALYIVSEMLEQKSKRYKVLYK